MSQEDTPETGQESVSETPKPEGEPSGFNALPAETQAEIKALRSEAARHRKDAQEARAKVDEYEAANATEIEKAGKRAERAEKEAAEARASLLRFEVAAEKRIPAEAVDLLVGSTREELEAKADRILELAKGSEPTPEFDGGAREPAPVPRSPEDAHNAFLMDLFGRPQNQ